MVKASEGVEVDHHPNFLVEDHPFGPKFLADYALFCLCRILYEYLLLYGRGLRLSNLFLCWVAGETCSLEDNLVYPVPDLCLYLYSFPILCLYTNP